MSVKVKNADGTWSQVGGMMKPGFQDITGNPSDNANLNAALNAKSTVSVSATGTSTDEVQYITIDGVEKKLAGGGTGTVTDVKVDGTSVVSGGVASIDLTGKASATDLETHTTNSTIHVTSSDKSEWSSKQPALNGDQIAAANSGITGALVSDYNSHLSDSDIHITIDERIAWDCKYSKPSAGIPKTDLIGLVQTSLGKADTAYQKAITGIPKSDLAADVQTSLGLANTALQAHQDISGKANTSDLTAHTGNTSNPHSVTASQIGLGNVENKSAATILGELTSSQITTALGFTPFDNAKLGASNGAAQLGSDGIVPASQLPSYLDEIVEVSDYAHLPAIGLTNKIYRTLDNYKSYRWGGTAYTEIPASLSLGETSSTAYAGDKGKIAYDHSQIAGGTGVHISDAERTSWTAKLTHAGTANNISLPTTGWTSNSITVTCTGMTATANFIVGPAPASHDDYSECGIICSAQGTDSLTFTRKKANANAIAVNLYIFG